MSSLNTQVLVDGLPRQPMACHDDTYPHCRLRVDSSDENASKGKLYLDGLYRSFGI
jgi:hypothetical protein